MSQHLNWNENSYKLFSSKILSINDIDFFNDHNIYEIRWLLTLGKGFFGVVDKYQLTIKNPQNSELKIVIVAGKRFERTYNSSESIREYFLKAFYIKKILSKDKKYTLRLFDVNKNIQKQKFVKVNKIFKREISLSKILFFPDFTFNKDILNAIPVNIKTKFNIDLLNPKYQLDIRLLLSNMIEDLFYLWKNGVKTNTLDIWLLLIIKNEGINFDLKIIDFDDIRIISSSDNIDEIKKNYNFIFNVFLEEDFLENYRNFVKSKIDEIFKI